MDPAMAGQPDLASLLLYYFAVKDVLDSSRTFLAVMVGVVVFEHVVTMKYEISYVWRASFSWTNLCLMLNRYGIIIELTVILYLFHFPHGSYEDCKRIYLFTAYCPLAVLVCANTLLTVRVFALWKKNMFILAGLCAIQITLIAVGIWNPIGSSPMQLPPGVPQLGLPDIKGCLPGGGGLGTYWVNGFLSSLFDGVAFVLSLIPCLAAWHASLKTGIGRILIRDGIVFFAVCFIASLANILYSVLSGEHANKAYLGPLACALQSMCASRMVFNLRGANAQSTNTSGLSGGAASRSRSAGGGSRLPNSFVHKVSRPGQSEQDIAAFSAGSTIHSPRFPDPRDGCEKGYELSDLQSVSDVKEKTGNTGSEPVLV